MIEIDTSTEAVERLANLLTDPRADGPFNLRVAATLRALAAERDALIAERAKLLAALKVCVMAHQTGIYDAACAAYEDAKVVLGMVPDPACDIAKEPSDDR
jgi:hypothetical protein